LTCDIRVRGEALSRILVVGVNDDACCCNGTP